MNDTEFAIVISSLLHDIGKFYMRTHTPEECKSLMTGKMLRHEDLLGRFKRDSEIEKIDIEKIDIEDDYVKLADWISAQEREKEEDSEIKNEELKEIRKKPLISVFHLSNGKSKNIFVKPKKISLDLPELEVVEKSDNLFSKDMYENFVDEIRDFLRKNKYFHGNKEKRKYFIRFLLDTFKKYLSKVPSASYYDEPTIDLYNHSRISAALALSLYRYFKDKKTVGLLKESMREIFKQKVEIEKNKSKNLEEILKKKKELEEKKEKDQYYNEKCFILFEGDISGIQSFISTVSTEGAMKVLSGRSFYIYFLNKIVALKLLKELDLPETNLIYCSGGHFEIICDNSKENIEKAKKLFDYVNKKLYENFRIKLFFSLSYSELSPRDLEFEKKEGDEIIFRKNKKYLFNKERKFENVIFDKDFDFILEKSKSNECKICKSESENDICDFCNKFKEDLRNYLKELKNKGKMLNKEWFNQILFFDDINDLIYNGNINLNQTEKNNLFDFLPLGLVLDNGQKIVELKDISANGKIASFKYDVDNLGNFLNPSNVKRKATFTYYARLSFEITLFFEGIINTIWEKYKDKIIIIYSGGDDGFVIGDPFAVLNFAKDVYNYFKIFTGLNEEFNITGAYRIFDDKYPVKKIFETLEDELKSAKQTRKEKNVISINGEVIRWDYFEGFKKQIFSPVSDENFTLEENDFEFMIKMTNYFIKLAQNEDISISMLYKIMELSNDAIEKMKKSLKEKRMILPNIYMLKYLVYRNLKPSVAEKIYSIWEKTILSNNMTGEGINNIIFRLKCIKLAAQLAMFYERINKRGGKSV